MTQSKIYSMSFKTLYPLYLNKLMKKGRSEGELKEVIEWLTAYKPSELDKKDMPEKTLQEFFESAPSLNPTREKAFLQFNPCSWIQRLTIDRM